MLHNTQKLTKNGFKSNNYKTPRKKHEEWLHDNGHGDDFMEMTPKA
jgi:hypothetical protein